MTTAELPASAPALETREEPLERVRVWDLVVRVTHWLIALALVVLSITGIYIGRPFLIVSGPASDHFVMGTIRAIHRYAAIVFSLSVLSRLIWMFIGSRPARWYNFIPVTRERWEQARGTFSFYVFARRRPPPCAGHNPLAGLAYTAVFFLYLVMIATGIALYLVGVPHGSLLEPFRFLIGLFGGAQTARWIHHIVMWLLIGFVVHHVYSAILVAVVEKNGTIDSIFSGNKWLPRTEAERNAPKSARRGGAGRERATGAARDLGAR